MKYTRIFVTPIAVFAVMLLATTTALASLDNSTPASGAHHVDTGMEIEARFTTTISGADSTTFVVHGERSGFHSGTYSGNSTDTLRFASSRGFVAGETVTATLTSGLTGLSSPEVISFRARTNRSTAHFDNDILLSVNASWSVGNAAGDVNGDGLPDLVTGSAIGGGGSVWTNPGNLNNWESLQGYVGLIQNPITFNTIGNSAYDVEVADINNDGYGDVIAAMNNSQLELYLYDSTTGGFQSGVQFGNSRTHYAAYAAELNGDGYMDIIACVYNSSTTNGRNYVCLNDGQGGFNAPMDIVGSRNWTTDCAVADFDGDGDMDVVFAGGAGGQQDEVYLNDGQGVLANPVNIGFSFDATDGIDAGDLDGDGDIDIVAGTSGGPIQYLNNGSAQFSNGTTIGVTGIRAGTIALGDMDGDGDLDVAVGVGNAGTSPGQSRIYFNNGDATWNGSQNFGGSNDSHWGPDIQLVDLDLDGDLDIFSGRGLTTPFFMLNGAELYDGSVWTYDHSGADPSITGITPNPAEVAASRSANISAGYSADMQGIDAAGISVHGSQRGRLTGAYSGNGTTSATFNPTADFGAGEVIEITLHGLYSETSFPDPQNPGQTITLTQQIAGGDVIRFRASAGVGPVEFTHKSVNLGGATTATSALVAGNFEGGSNHHVVAGIDGGVDILYTIPPSGTPTAANLPGGSTATKALALGDVDGDGFTDIAVAVGSGQNVVHLWDDTANDFSGGTLNFGTGSDDTRALAFADLDADGDLDLLVGNSLALDAAYLNDGSGNFTLQGTFGSATDDTRALAVADFDGDFDLDVAVATAAQADLVYLNDGRGNFKESRGFPVTSSDARAVQAGDFDGDGDVDLLFGYEAAADRVMLNDGTGRFYDAVTLTAGTTSTRAIELGDLDGDGDLDAVVVYASSAAEVFENDGSGAFTSITTFGAAGGSALSILDFDSDDDLDVLFARNGGQDVIHYNEELPTIGFQSAQFNAQENAGTAMVTVEVTQAYTEDVSVDWAAVAGTANSPADFTAASGTATITAGNTSTTFNVTINDDAIDELDETIQLSLSNPVNTLLGATNATLNILDDDGAPTIRFGSATYTQGEGGGSVTVTIEVSNISGLDVTVDYATSDDTATAGSDYTATSGQATVTAGNLSTTFSVPVSDDNIDEADETIDLALSGPTNATLGALATSVITITDDDATPTIDLAQTSVQANEFDGSTTISVGLTNPSSSPITVQYATQNGSANAGQDYVANTGTLTFNPGVVSQDITIVINDDPDNEPDESFQLILQNPSATAVLGTSTAVITILGDPADVFTLGGTGGGSGSGGGGGGCAADTGTTWMILLSLIVLLGVSLRRKQA